MAGTDSIMWGQMHEGKANQEYIKLTGNTVKPVGLVLLPSGFLGCSPDGLIYAKGIVSNNGGVLEIKCPWKHRNHTIAAIMTEEVGKTNKPTPFT